MQVKLVLLVDISTHIRRVFTHNKYELNANIIDTRGGQIS